MAQGHLYPPQAPVSPQWKSARVPLVPGFLGAAGVLPFIFFAFEHQPVSDRAPPTWDAPVARVAAVFGLSGLPLLTAGDQRGVRKRFLAYGATILSFLGAVHWGLAMASPIPASPSRYFVSVVPSLVAWAALDAELAANDASAVVPYTLLGAGLVGAFLYDEAAASAGNVPRWYPALRAPATFIALGATCACVYLGAEPRSRRAV
jgi:hypothetical protein